jgi:uncharacterized protein (DUF1499 family)
MVGILVRAVRLVVLAFLLVALALLAFGHFVGFAAPTPDGLGVRDGRLAACPPTPNCVSSTADDPAQRVAPLSLPGSAAQRMSVLREVLLEQPGVAIVDERAGYLHATVRTRWLGFVDDLELLQDDAAGVVQVRSASRIGYSDLGANRARLQELAARLTARGEGVAAPAAVDASRRVEPTGPSAP